MLFHNLSRTRGIGSNCYLVEWGGEHIVLDAGMSPKEEGSEALPRLDGLPAEGPSAVVVTHCHLDHVGSLPLVMRRNPLAPVFMTETTGALTEAMLHNSVNVMTSKREELGETAYPFFTHSEVEEAARQWAYRRLEQTFSIGPGVEATLYHAGHIAGSAGVLLECDGRRVFYTGDVQFSDQTMTPAATFPEDAVDTLVMETTRGAAPLPGYDREEEKRRLGRAIAKSFTGGGSALIPVFATGKTQEVLMMVHELKEEGILPSCPVFIGGLSTKMTAIADRFADRTPRRYPNFKILEEMELNAAPRRRRQELRYSPRCIYALSSGMMMEHTLSNTFGRQFIDNPRNSLLFVGYVDPDTPAAKILRASPGDPIELDSDLAPVELRCAVDTFDFSGHASREELLDYAVRLRPENIILVHGDDDAMEWFRDSLRRELPRTRVFLPEGGESVDLR